MSCQLQMSSRAPRSMVLLFLCSGPMFTKINSQNFVASFDEIQETSRAYCLEKSTPRTWKANGWVTDMAIHLTACITSASSVPAELKYTYCRYTFVVLAPIRDGLWKHIGPLEMVITEIPWARGHFNKSVHLIHVSLCGDQLFIPHRWADSKTPSHKVADLCYPATGTAASLLPLMINLCEP